MYSVLIFKLSTFNGKVHQTRRVEIPNRQFEQTNKSKYKFKPTKNNGTTTLKKHDTINSDKHTSPTINPSKHTNPAINSIKSNKHCWNLLNYSWT